jgi:hypothetical protein
MSRSVRSITVVAFAVVAGCGGAGSGDGTGDDTAVLASSAGAPPCSYAHVYVTARSLSVRVQGESSEAWHDISLPAPRRIDLMNRGAGVFDAMRIAPLPAGRYRELRLLLDTDPAGHAFESSDGSLVPLTVPGGAASGLKFLGDFQVAPWRSADVVPDAFDACASVVTAGNSGKYQLNPVIQAHAVATPADQEVRMAGIPMLPLPTGGFAALKSNEQAIGASPEAAILQRFAPEGAYAGAEIRFPLSSTLLARVAPLRNGNYVLTSFLNPEFGPGPPTQSYRFLTQLYDAAGTPQGTLQQVGLAFPFSLSHVVPGTYPTTAALSGGGYAILWSDLCCRYLLSSADGGSSGAPRTVDVQSPAQVIALATGGFMVVAGLQSVVAVPFAADGTQLGSPQQVGTTQAMPGPKTWTGVAASPLAAGGAVVVWANEVSVTSGEKPALQMRLVANDGSPVGDAFALGPVDLGPTSVAGLDDGGFVVAWVYGGHVLARRFTADGTPAGVATRVDAFTTFVGEASVISTGAGGFLVNWSGTGPDGQLAVRYGRLFDPSGLLGS